MEDNSKSNGEVKEDYIVFLDVDQIKSVQDVVNVFKALQVDFSIVESVLAPEYEYLFKRMEINDKNI